ncbi:unnamed protein product [Cuscuta campestris]|uniref:Uncharacterized protein n=1 Tax=Cuscuta campestris TaxID=132261 RepID=A0A484LCV7_9ASTE|nr:unnamed protein product [Cuscuta campestris]
MLAKARKTHENRETERRRHIIKSTQHIVISSLRPQFRCLGDVAIPYATGAVWQRRQLFVATPTIIECVFVDAGVAVIDIETKHRKEEIRLKEAQAQAVIEHGELALITVDGKQTAANERIALRSPMLQQPKAESDDSGMLKVTEERRVSEVSVGEGGVVVAVTRFPAEQKRPIGPLVIVGVRDGVLWLVDRYMEHHDDLAQFMLGIGYATEALHLPGISNKLEFDLAMLSNDLRRALQCLLTMSNSRDISQEALCLDLRDIMSLTEKKENIVEAVQGIVKFVKEFMDLINAADATGQSNIAREALKRLAAAGAVKGALQGQELRGVALRLANHGELTGLAGDNGLMEKAWQETGMLADAVLHAHADGRPSLRSLVQSWNKMLQKELECISSTKTDAAAAAFLASLEKPKLTSLGDAAKKPPIGILQKSDTPILLEGSKTPPPKPTDLLAPDAPPQESAPQPPPPPLQQQGSSGPQQSEESVDAAPQSV